MKNDDVEVWVYITAFPSEASVYLIEKWLKDHIKEDGVAVKNFEVVEIANLLNPADRKNSNFAIISP